MISWKLWPIPLFFNWIPLLFHEIPSSFLWFSVNYSSEKIEHPSLSKYDSLNALILLNFLIYLSNPNDKNSTV